MKQKTEFMRVEKTKNYSVISNEFIRRKDLSWKAKGILTYILTLPDDWVININEIMTHATEGEKAFRSGWKELKDAGYVNRYPVRDKDSNKITHWETVIRESVDTKGFEPLTQNVQVQKVQVQNVQVQNDKLQSTYITNNLDKQNTESNKDSQQSQKRYADDSQYMKAAVYLFEKIKERLPNKKEPDFQKWADEVRKTVELDGVPVERYKEVLDWSQNDDFWQANILSTNKLRKQFDTIYLQMQRDNKQNAPKVNDDWDYRKELYGE